MYLNWLLLKLGKEICLQLVPQMCCKFATAIDPEGCGQWLPQAGHESIPLALGYNALPLVVLLESLIFCWSLLVAIAILVWDAPLLPDIWPFFFVVTL